MQLTWTGIKENFPVGSLDFRISRERSGHRTERVPGGGADVPTRIAHVEGEPCDGPPLSGLGFDSLHLRVDVRPDDIAYIAFGYGSFIGFWGLHYAMEKIGVLNVPGGAQTTEARVLQIIDFGATVVAATPTYAIRLAWSEFTA